jgi:GntR family transcriptional repressor for pyruvate dehydrogenase complex
MATFTTIASQRTTDQVVEQIRQAIADGRYGHEAKLPAERELATQFGVSRGVIREAIKILNGMGLVESRQGSGIFVQNDPVPVITRALTLSLTREPHMVQQLFDIRAALESLAVASAVRHHTPADLAAMRAFVAGDQSVDAATMDLDSASDDDRAFHLAVAQAADNPYLVTLVQVVSELIQETFPITEDLRTGMTSARSTHARIVDAIEKRDEDLAVRLMREHIARSGASAQETARLATEHD